MVLVVFLIQLALVTFADASPETDGCGKVSGAIPTEVIMAAAAFLDAHADSQNPVAPFSYVDTHWSESHHEYEIAFTDSVGDHYELDVNEALVVLLIEKTIHESAVPDNVKSAFHDAVPDMDWHTCAVEYAVHFDGDVEGRHGYEFDDCHSLDGHLIDKEVDIDEKTLAVVVADDDTHIDCDMTKCKALPVAHADAAHGTDTCGKVTTAVPNEMLTAAVVFLEAHADSQNPVAPFSYVDTHWSASHHEYEVAFLDGAGTHYEVDINEAHEVLLIEKTIHGDDVPEDVKSAFHDAVPEMDWHTCAVEYAVHFEGDVEGSHGYEFDDCHDSDGHLIHKEVDIDESTLKVEIHDDDTHLDCETMCHESPETDGCGKVSGPVPNDVIHAARDFLDAHADSQNPHPPFSYVDTHWSESHHEWEVAFSDNFKDHYELDVKNNKGLEVTLIEKTIKESDVPENVKSAFHDAVPDMDWHTCAIEYAVHFDGDEEGSHAYEFDDCHDSDGHLINLEVDIDEKTLEVEIHDDDTHLDCDTITCQDLKEHYKASNCCGMSSKSVPLPVASSDH